MSFESKINSIIFFPSIKNGLYDYDFPIKSELKNFFENKKFELSSSLLEYIIYKNIKKQFLDNNFINKDIALIIEKYLTLLKNRDNLINLNKKHLIILFQNENTQKWNLIIFLNFMEQIRNNIDLGLKLPIITKIISSNSNSDDDNYILNKTMDDLENIFDFKIPDDVNFEVDSINISEYINTSIFVINFIIGLISKNDTNLNSYVKELFNEKMISSINDKNYKNDDIKKNYINHFNSFCTINENLENILFDYENELNEYLLNNNIANNILNDFQDNIDDLKSEDEEEALRIMEEHNKESKRKKKEKKETLNCNKKLNLEGINIFGVIKEEDKESSSNSFESLSHNKKRIKKEKFKIESRNNEFYKKNKSFNIKNNLNIGNISNQNKISNKIINDNILDELKEAIKEFEFDEKPICKTEVNNINNIKLHKTNHIKHKNNRKYLSDILARKERNGIEILLVPKENERIKKRKKRRKIEEKNKEKENLKNKSIENENGKKLINIKYLEGYKDKYKINKNNLIEMKSYDTKLNLKLSKKKGSRINNIESPSEIKYSSRKRKNNSSLYNNSQSLDEIRNINSIKHKIHINKNKDNKEKKDSSYLLKKNSNIIINNKKNLIKNLLKAKNDLKRKKNSKSLLSKLSNNSLKSTSFKSEDSINNLKIKTKDLEIKIEKSITDFSIFDNPNICKDNNKMNDKNKDFYQIINKIKIKNKENDKNSKTNITHSSLNSLYEIKYNEEVEVKNNKKDFIGKEYTFKEPTLKMGNKDKYYSIFPRKSNTINVDDYCHFYEGNKNNECGCIGGKNEDTFCSIF